MHLMVAAASAVLLTLGALPATAQDEPPPERVEVPAAAMAIAFPGGWSADIEMREREDWGLYDEGLAEEPVVFWKVVYASDGGWPWCEVEWYPSYPMPLSEHADRYQALMTPTHSDVERTIEVEPVTVPAGEAFRLVIYNQPTDDHTTTYIVDDAGARYLISCASTERADEDWLAVVQSLELGSMSKESSSPEPEEE